MIAWKNKIKTEYQIKLHHSWMKLNETSSTVYTAGM